MIRDREEEIKALIAKAGDKDRTFTNYAAQFIFAAKAYAA